MRRLFACAISALVISGCDRPADLVGPQDPLEGRTASADQIVDLGTLGGSWAVAMGINNRGEVVGFSGTASGGVSAFIWTRQGGMTALSGLTGLDDPSRAVAINELGQVAGNLSDGPFLWTGEAMVRDFVPPQTPYVVQIPYHATALNDKGQVLLMNWVFSFVWSSDKPAVLVRCGEEEWAYGINNLGQVVGEVDYTRTATWESPEPYGGYDLRLGFLWDPETRQCPLVENAAWLATNVVTINDNGVMTGEGGTIASSYSYHRFLSGPPSLIRVTSAGGFGFVALGTLGGHDTRGRASAGEAVNERGDVAGYSFTSSGARHAFVWTQKGGMKDLGTLGGAESAAMGINAKGDVAGWSLDAAGNRRAVLWTKSGGSINKSSGVASRPSFNLAPAPAKSFEVASCPGRPGMLLEIGALDRCPVRDDQVRQ